MGQNWPRETRESDEVAVRKPVRFNDIDKDLFLAKLCEVNGPDDVHTCASKISESLYTSAVSSRADPAQHRDDGGLDSWAGQLSDASGKL